MPSGIILSSGSQGATKEAIEKVLSDNGLEAEKAAEPEVPAAPQPEDFETDEEYEKAKEAFEESEQERQEQDEEHEAAAAGAKPAKLTRRQKAIERATRDLKEENRKLHERLAAIESGKKPANETAQPKLEAPKREAFKTDEEFEDAKFEYRYKLRRQKEQKEETLRLAKEHLKRVEEGYRSSVSKFREGLEVDDWDEVVNQSLPVHDAVINSIAELENGPAVTYYLGKHPDFTKKIAEMSPYSAVMEVGRLAARLKTGAGSNRPEAGSGARPKPRVKIPAPVRPLNSSAKNSTMSSREAAEARDFRAFKAAQRARR